MDMENVIEKLSEEVHVQWMNTKRSQGVESRKAQDGEELMVPYDQLSEQAKELDRNTVRTVLAALYFSDYTVIKSNS